MGDLTNGEIAELRRMYAAGTDAGGPGEHPMVSYAEGPWVAPGGGRLERDDGASLLFESTGTFVEPADAALTASARNAMPRLLDEVQRHRANLEALESNIEHWPATYDTARTLHAIREARAGFLLETLT